MCRIFAVGGNIADVDDAALKDRSSRGGATIKRRGKRVLHRRQLSLGQAVISHEMDKAVPQSKDGAIGRLAQHGGAVRDGVEHRLHVGRRTRDHPQDFCGSRLLLQRLLQVARLAPAPPRTAARSRWRSSPDRRRSGRSSIWRSVNAPGSGRMSVNAPSALSLRNQRSAENRPVVPNLGRLAIVVLGVREHVGDVHCLPRDHHPTGHGLPSQAVRIRVDVLNKLRPAPRIPRASAGRRPRGGKR